MSWQLASLLLLLALALAAGFAWYERAQPAARVLALVATLAALAALGRIAFAPMPNVKPTTDIVLLSGFALGGAPGLRRRRRRRAGLEPLLRPGPVDAVADGGLGRCRASLGAALARVARRDLGRVPLAAAAASPAWLRRVMDLSIVGRRSRRPHARPSTLAIVGAVAAVQHRARGRQRRLLPRVRAGARARARCASATRFEVTLARRVAGGRRSAAVALLAARCAASPQRRAAASRRRATSSAPRTPTAASAGAPGAGARRELLHGLGRARARRRRARPARRRARQSAARPHARGATASTDVGDARAHDPRARAPPARAAPIAGRDLVAELRARQRRDGSFERLREPDGVRRPRAARGGPRRERPRGRARGALARAPAEPRRRLQLRGRGGPSGIDDTAAALQALAAGGRRGARRCARACGFLRARQNPDGGFPLQPRRRLQRAVDRVGGPGPRRRRPRPDTRAPRRLALAARLPALAQAADGSVRYTRTSAQTPVWVTAQATALAAAAARRPRRRSGARRGRPRAEAAGASAQPAPLAALPRPSRRACYGRTAAGEPLTRPYTVRRPS